MCPDRNPICIGNTELSLGTADSDGLSYGDRVQHGLGASGLCDPVCLVARGQGAHPTQPPFQRSLLPCSGLGAGWHRFHSLRWAGKDPHCGCRLKLFQKQLIFIGHRCSESFCASLRRTLQVWWQRRSRHRERAPFCRATGGLSWGLRGAAGSGCPYSVPSVRQWWILPLVALYLVQCVGACSGGSLPCVSICCSAWQALGWLQNADDKTGDERHWCDLGAWSCLASVGAGTRLHYDDTPLSPAAVPALGLARLCLLPCTAPRRACIPPARPGGPGVSQHHWGALQSSRTEQGQDLPGKQGSAGGDGRSGT